MTINYRAHAITAGITATDEQLSAFASLVIGEGVNNVEHHLMRSHWNTPAERHEDEETAIALWHIAQQRPDAHD
jgi:hypothetical protein